MLRFLKTLIVLISFTVDIHVRAETLLEPLNCWEKAIHPCALLNESGIIEKSSNNFNLRMGEKTSIRREADKSITLLVGRALIDTEGALSVKTLYGEIQVHRARVMVFSNSQQVQFTNLRGSLKFIPRGSSSAGELPVGFSNYMSRVDGSGISPSGYSEPAVIKSLLTDWASFFKKSESEIYRAQVKEFESPWKSAIDLAGPWYVDTAQRQIAALDAERERRAREALARLKEEKFFQEMFRRRNNFE